MNEQRRETVERDMIPKLQKYNPLLKTQTTSKINNVLTAINISILIINIDISDLFFQSKDRGTLVG